MWMALVSFAAFSASLIGTRLALAWLRRRAILDHPNERSSHRLPTPRGGGLAVAPVAIVAIALAGGNPAVQMAGIAFGLAAVSWWDDLKDVAPLWRFMAQILAVVAALVLPPFSGPVFQGVLPPAVDAFLSGVLWLWFLNLFNFMDGIDGITGVETACLGGGIAGVALLAGIGEGIALHGLVLAAAALGFLWWNWHPAKIFLGDVGSVTLGFLLGWLLLDLAARGQWAAALILPAYYLADATITLVRRAARGEKVWRAHREHFYQKAVQAGLSHAAVSGAVLVADLALVSSALLAASGSPGPAFGSAVAAVGGLLFFLATRRARGINGP